MATKTKGSKNKLYKNHEIIYKILFLLFFKLRRRWVDRLFFSVTSKLWRLSRWSRTLDPLLSQKPFPFLPAYPMSYGLHNNKKQGYPQKFAVYLRFFLLVFKHLNVLVILPPSRGAENKAFLSRTTTFWRWTTTFWRWTITFTKR